LPADGQKEGERLCIQDMEGRQEGGEAVQEAATELWDKGYRLEAWKHDIHADNIRQFMTEELGVEDWYRQILQEGLYPDFVSTLQQYREDKNRQQNETWTQSGKKSQNGSSQGR
jgi:hypothetical protein